MDTAVASAFGVNLGHIANERSVRVRRGLGSNHRLRDWIRVLAVSIVPRK